MSLDLESGLRVFLSSAPQRLRSIPTIEIRHSAMSKTYYLWHEPFYGEATLDDGSVIEMQPCNIEIKLAGSSGHLDQKFDIRLDLTGVEDEFREQMDLIPVDTQEKIRVIYREYLSDDLTSIQAQVALQAEAVSYAIGAATINAVSPRLNMTRTGELYLPKDVPMLRGFV